MSRRVDLPDQAEIHRAREEVLSAAGATGKKPTVVALAKKLGMSHSTFWRHFPDIAQNLVASARTGDPSAPEETVPNRYDQLKDDHAKLKRTATELEQNLELAKAVIQRISLENHQLRKQLEGAAQVASLERKRRTHDGLE